MVLNIDELSEDANEHAAGRKHDDPPEVDRRARPLILLSPADNFDCGGGARHRGVTEYSSSWQENLSSCRWSRWSVQTRDEPHDCSPSSL